MGFFKDFKDDLSETANDLAKEAQNVKVDSDKSDDVMVNTLDDPELAKMAADLKKEVDTQETQEKNTTVNDASDSSNSTATVLKKEADYEADVETLNAASYAAVTEETEEAEEDTEAISDETAVITVGLSVTGNLESTGSIDVFGTVTGNVTCRGKLTVSGTIAGDSKASEIFANNAQVDGNIHSTGSVKVGQGTVIVGNIAATSAVIAGAVKGDIDVHGPVVVDSTAIIVGDIKSKTVQINNGATIDGRCSQCYADVNTDSIFDIKTKKSKTNK